MKPTIYYSFCNSFNPLISAQSSNVKVIPENVGQLIKSYIPKNERWRIRFFTRKNLQDYEECPPFYYDAIDLYIEIVNNYFFHFIPKNDFKETMEFLFYDDLEIEKQRYVQFRIFQILLNYIVDHTTQANTITNYIAEQLLKMPSLSKIFVKDKKNNIFVCSLKTTNYEKVDIVPYMTQLFVPMIHGISKFFGSIYKNNHHDKIKKQIRSTLQKINYDKLIRQIRMGFGVYFEDGPTKKKRKIK